MNDDSPSPSNEDEDELLGRARGVPPIVPDGEYVGSFKRVERGRYERRDRLYLWFAIMTPGPFVGAELFLACPCPEKGRVFGIGSKLVVAYAVAEGRLPRRKDRISTRVFKNKLFRFQTRTVVKDGYGKPRPTADYYSVIDKLIDVEVG